MLTKEIIGAAIPIVSVISALTFTVLERWKPYREGVPLFRKGFFVDLIWYTLIQSAVLVWAWFGWIFDWSRSYLGLPEEGILNHWPLWALWLFFFVTHDFYIYWFHRAQHHTKWLWRTHEAHHSVQDVDYLAGGRSHIVEILINQTIEFAPIYFLLGGEKAFIMAGLKAMTDSVYGMFIHANLDVKMGWLGYVFNGPRQHQWHHAEHKEVYYANYSTKLALWDRLFGTYFDPDYKPSVWGLPYDFPKDYFAQHVFAFWRFDVKKLEESKTYQAYDNIRVNLLNAIRKGIGLPPLDNGYIRAPEPQNPEHAFEEVHEGVFAK